MRFGVPLSDGVGVPRAQAQTLFLSIVDIGCVALETVKLICDRSIHTVL